MRNELPLHDATFDGIVMSGQTATLFFTTSTGTTSEVSLSGVDALQIDDFREGNIAVLFEEVREERPSSKVDMSRLYIQPHPSASEQYHEKYHLFLETELAAVERGELSLVVMEPAIGANLLAICKKMSLVTR